MLHLELSFSNSYKREKYWHFKIPACIIYIFEGKFSNNMLGSHWSYDSSINVYRTLRIGRNDSSRPPEGI